MKAKRGDSKPKIRNYSNKRGQESKPRPEIDTVEALRSVI